MTVSLLFAISALLALASALTLFAKNEGIRGSGRVIGGFAWICFGIFLLNAPINTESLPGYLAFSSLVVLTGVITLGSGVRKYLRRNVPQ